MDKEIRESILQVAQAIENLNRAFDRRADELRRSGDAEGLQQWLNACYAMRDSGNIYITWARHYARSTEAAQPSGGTGEALLDEGALWDEDQPGPG